MRPPKIRVETVVAEGGHYRDPAREQRVSAGARTGLTRRWRKLPAFIADLAISLASFVGFLSGVAALALGSLVWDDHTRTSGIMVAFVFFTILAPILYLGGKTLDRRRKEWRDARRAHEESVLTIGRDALRVGGRTINKEELTGVRVEKQKSKSPAAQGRTVEVRYDVVLDVKGAEPVHALEALEEDELDDVLAAFAEGGLEVDR